MEKAIQLTMQSAASIIICFLFTGCKPAADVMFVNGRVFTSDTTRLYVEALAVTGNTISATGSNSAVGRLAGRKTRVIDLKGKTVVPGFNDAHVHLGWNTPSGNTYQYVPESKFGLTRKAIVDSLVLVVNRSKRGQWIYGSIGLNALYDSANFRKELLDSIAPHNPVVLQIWWGHGIIASSKAFEALSISNDAIDPIGGWYERKKGTGELTGAVYEYAQWPFWNALTLQEAATFINDLKQADEDFIRHGVTTFQHMNILSQPRVAVELFSKANLKTRCRLISMIGTSEKGRMVEGLNNYQVLSDNKLYVSGLKYLLDGTPLDRTALLTMPYPDKHDWFGRLDFPLDTVKQILVESLESDMQTLLHIVGDSTMSLVLNLMKEMASDDEWRKRRIRIEHNSTGHITPDQMGQIQSLGLIMMHTPQYGHFSKLASWIRMGVPLGVSPDGITNPFVNIKTMTAEQRFPSENITREQAVIAYTLVNAWAEFKEQSKGSISSGKLADLAILSHDVFSVPDHQLSQIKSLLTMVNGEIIYEDHERMR
jgi:predicted amidohydrolase YtcJ